jgi:hypothetical protein
VTVALELEIKIGKNHYRASRLSIFEQMNMAAEFREVLAGLAMLKKERPKDMDDASYSKTVEFLMTARGGISPEVRERVMHRCFGAVTRRSGVGWQPIQTVEGVLQFSDIELPESVAIMYAVFEHNKLLDFFSASPSASDGQPKEAEAGLNLKTARTG